MGAEAHDFASALTTPTAVIPVGIGYSSQGAGSAGNQFGQRCRSIGAFQTGNRCISCIQSDVNSLDHEFQGFVELRHLQGWSQL